ncbi:transposon Ty3-G Gag-Pol polyprotein [Nephila pilipes]|uniref:Transposon Ty3-G Gag-Pol polyprotein n=1 Tax=Nephila pilipes TaxID=299642 RepID=A0A8X6U7B0_NEPPI|nr:transposon Ty3-G Gag-Pol polyprotein [Nephila pilipes]
MTRKSNETDYFLEPFCLPHNEKGMNTLGSNWSAKNPSLKCIRYFSPPELIGTTSGSKTTFVTRGTRSNASFSFSSSSTTTTCRFVTKDFFHSPCTFLRLDRVRRSLESPYAGPYKVVKRTSKVFKLEMDGQQHTVFIDRLKPAPLFSDFDNKNTPSDVITRFSRLSRPVVGLQSSPSS